MRVQLDLPRTIEDKVVIIVVLGEEVLQPIQVLHEVFHTIHKTTIGSIAKLFHHIFDANQIADIERHGVLEMVRCRIEVHDVRHSPGRGAELVHIVAVRGPCPCPQGPSPAGSSAYCSLDQTLFLFASRALLLGDNWMAQFRSTITPSFYSVRSYFTTKFKFIPHGGSRIIEVALPSLHHPPPKGNPMNAPQRTVNSSPLKGLSPTELDAYAQYAWLSGRVGEAIDMYSDLARLHRRSPHVHFKLGYLYLSLQDHTTAVRHFTAEIERHGDEVFDVSSSPTKSKTQGLSQQQQHQQHAFLFCTYAGRSEAFQALGEESKADMDQLYMSNRGAELKPNLLAMGRLYFQFGMHQRAEQCFERCAEIDSEDPEYLLEHAELRLSQRRHALAAGMFEKSRNHISSSSAMYHRALIGEGCALIRQEKLQDAVILLLQATNMLRSTIRSSLGELASPSLENGTSDIQPRTHSEGVKELVHLYHRATNLYGGLCLMKGELKAALDTYCSILQPSSAFTNVVPFQLPMMCVTPGTKNKFGDVIDSAKISTKSLSEAVRHLNELEWRYGPDACLYFHRANLYRATGDFNSYVHDLSLVESMDPNFLKGYSRRDCFGDFLETETISWIPVKLVESIHDALEQNEYRIPSAHQGPTAAPSILATKQKGKGKGQTGHSTAVLKHRLYSEVSMLAYFHNRTKHNDMHDEYAKVYQIDILRRLPESKRVPGKLHTVDLAQWEGVVFDDVYGDDAKSTDQDKSFRDLIDNLIATHGKHPCVHMFAGMVELEKFNVGVARKHFTDAVDLVDRLSTSSAADDNSSSQSSLSQRWQRQLMQQVKYYSLVWRSMANRVKIEMERAVEDLNIAASIRLGDKICGSDDPLLLIQRTLIMLLNGHLKSAYKLLRQLKKGIRQARRLRPKWREVVANEALEVADMFGCGGLSTFHLLPIQVMREYKMVGREAAQGEAYSGDVDAEHDARDRADEEREEREEEESAISIVKYALTKKSGSQTDMLDRFFDSGILKLSVTGSISQVIPFFQAILSIDESYLSPTNFASLEIFKCKEQEFMEEKLFNCFVRLGKRSRWLENKIKWKFEALIDSNLAHAYLPTDLETLWHRSRLFQGQKNFNAAINDLTDCLHLMTPHFSWEKGKTGEKASFNNEAKRTQWLQLQLERGLLYMEVQQWNKALDDLTMVIAQSGKSNPALQAGAYEARSGCSVRMKRYGHAIQDLQQLLGLQENEKKTKKSAVEDLRRQEDRLLNCVLVGNLYCQLAVDQIKTGSALTRKASVTSNHLLMKQARTAHLNMGFITRAGEYYTGAEELMPDHFLVHYFRGRLFAISGQSQLATRSLTECLRLHPMFLPALFLRGCVYAQENLFVLALADYYRVRHRIVTYPNLHTSIGYCHLERGSLRKATESFTEAIIQHPDDVNALYMRGCALQELMVLENALKDFGQAIAFSPEHHRAYYQRALCNILLKNYKAALQDMVIVVRLQPEWKDAWILYGYASFCAGSYDMAVNAYGSAIALPSASDSEGEKSRECDSALFLYRAISYMQSGKYAAALTDLDLALKRDNENYVAFLAKAYSLSKIGEKDQAAQILIHCLENYKHIQLMPAIEVLDCERTKELMKNDQLRESNYVNNAPPGFGHSILSETPNDIKPVPTIAASPDKLFHHRKYLRDCEPKQVLKSFTSFAERRASFKTMNYEKRGSVTNLIERRKSSFSSQPLGELTSRVSRRFSNLASSGADTAEEQARIRSKQLLQSKFLRVMKKLTFQHRVLRALENMTSSKYKKSQTMIRVLTEIMQPVTKVGWPKGTLTTRLLVWAFNALGIHHMHKKKIDDALMAFTLAIQAHPLDATTYFNRANVYLQIGVLQSAVNGYQDAIDQEENCYCAQNNMGVAYYRLGRLDEAQEAFSTGLHHVQDSKEKAILLYNLGVIFQALDKQDEALDFYQQAIAQDASRTEFFNNRSAILHNQMRYAVALDDYNRALKLQEETRDDDDEMRELCSGYEARLNRAQLHIAMGNCTLASQDLREVLTTLAELQDHFVSDVGASSGPSLTSSAMEVTQESLKVDLQLASELLVFCQKWRTAMRIAVKDFLFALHALPVFAAYELSPLLGPELVRLQENETEKAHSEDEGDLFDADRLGIALLPIHDSSFFNYKREFSYWRINDDENDEHDVEEQDAVRDCKRDQMVRSYSSDIRDSLRCARSDNYEEAARCLLRAHYKTTLDSHDEYLLLAWRIQVTTQISNDDADYLTDFGMKKAIMLLREFLEERRTPEENALDSELDGTGSRSHHRSSIDDGEDDLDNQMQWKDQRRVIRADLFSQLGSLYQLDGQLVEAQLSFQHALRLRSDHVFAALNFLQVSAALGEYEAALDASLHLLGVFLAIGNKVKSQTPSSSLTKAPRGLLNADRSILFMLPSLRDAFSDEEMAALGSQLLTLLKEYRGLISSQIQANTAYIFKTQGAIAHVVQQLRSAVKRLRHGQDVGNTQGTPLGSTLDLSSFNTMLDQYQGKIVAEPARFSEEADFREFYNGFQTQFAQLCEEVAKNLPTPTNGEHDEGYDPELHGHDNQATTITEQTVEEETIEEFLASIERRGGTARRSSGRSRARPVSGGSADTPYAIPSARRVSVLPSTMGLQPQRPKSGPQNTPRRRNY